MSNHPASPPNADIRPKGALYPACLWCLLACAGLAPTARAQYQFGSGQMRWDADKKTA
jgi:hypothetical protein